MTPDMENRVGKWFKPDFDDGFPNYLSTIDPSNKVLGYRGMGGPEFDGRAYALLIDGRTYVFAGLRQQIRDEKGNPKRSEKGRQGYFGYRYYDVRFQNSLRDGYQKKEFVADDLSDNEAHQKAVEIAVEFLSLLGLLDAKIPPIREIQFMQEPSIFGGDPRNPSEVIKVNQDAD